MLCMSCTQKDLFSKVQQRFRSNLGGDVYPDGMDGVEIGTRQMRSGTVPRALQNIMDVDVTKSMRMSDEKGMDVGWSKVTKTTDGKGKVDIKKKV
ncbi:hypothetical protein M422DRAFT_28467, partial [Sphaerobolus stellatus SS14]